MSETISSLRDEFARAFDEHLNGGEEAALLTAYDLGRKALAGGLGVLDVSTLLHEALLAVCVRHPEDSPRLVQAASNFALECLSSFEMAYRAVAEANTALRGLNDLLEQQTRRISHELHDQAGQLLAAVYLQLDEIARDLPGDSGDRVKSVRDLLDSIEDHLRRISHELRPTILDDLGLVAALEFLADGVSARTGIAISVEGPRQTRFPETTELVLYRIAQEALTNACKHARATAIRISVEQDGSELRCCIADDGAGFDAHSVLAGAGARGIGLMGIRERLMPLGGALRIDSAPGRGTELLVVVPLGDMPAAAPVIPQVGMGPSPD